MFSNMGRYLEMKGKASKLPHVEVTEKEFIRLMVEAGETKEKAKFQATMSKGLGSSVMIGDKMVSIKGK
jgi:hypothetical protein